MNILEITLFAASLIVGGAGLLVYWRTLKLLRNNADNQSFKDNKP
jgi:hypothetical protein